MTETSPTPAPTPNMGIRIEVYEPDDKKLIGAILREDLHTTLLPRTGERIAPSSFDVPLSSLTGLLPTIESVEHYLRIPDGRSEKTHSFAMLVIHANGVRRADFDRHAPGLEAQGWHIMEFDRFPDSF